jgi:intracellular septation protein A
MDAQQDGGAVPEGDELAAGQAIAGSVSVKSILIGSGPRFGRDAFGPVLGFYIGQKLWGVAVGILLATAAALGAWAWERRQQRPGLMARMSAALVIVQAVVGLIANDAKVFLAQSVLLTGIFGAAFVVSTFIGRPIAGAFATEMYDFPPEVRASHTFRTVFGRVSLAWGMFMLLRAALRAMTLANLSIDAFVAISFITGAPLTALLIGWSVWYGRRGFQRSAEWGWAFTEPVPAPAA